VRAREAVAHSASRQREELRWQMTHTPSEDATILRVTAALFVMSVVALAGLALVGSLATVVDLADSTQSVASYAVLVTALLVAAIHARRDPGG